MYCGVGPVEKLAGKFRDFLQGRPAQMVFQERG
jgi:hypothetical protein